MPPTCEADVAAAALTSLAHSGLLTGEEQAAIPIRVRAVSVPT